MKMLLDDSRHYFITKSLAAQIIQEAQVRIVRKAYKEGDERCLRPLYVTHSAIESGLPLSSDKLMFPKSCVWYQTSDYALIGIGEILSYQSPEIYFSFPGDLGLRSRAGFYTVTKERYVNLNVDERRDFLYFTGDINNYASLTYIRYPVVFGLNALEIPAEYHPSVVAMAAELANDIDVGESERGAPVFQNQQLSIENVAIQ